MGRVLRKVGKVLPTVGQKIISDSFELPHIFVSMADMGQGGEGKAKGTEVWYKRESKMG